jgi:hypothetical protein
LPLIPVAVPQVLADGTHYYEIELVEYTQQMHSDLPPTKLRGYRQAGGTPSYLGPAIVAQKDVPVRILFRNLLPKGAGGNLFIPVDTTVMGSGPGQGMPMMDNLADPQNPLCSSIDPNTGLKDSRCYTENRATLHLQAASRPGSATARRTSGSRPPTKTPPIRRASVCDPCRIWATAAAQLMGK